MGYISHGKSLRLQHLKNMILVGKCHDMVKYVSKETHLEGNYVQIIVYQC